jgi:transposase-like protein
MSELEATARAAGITPSVIEAVRQVHEEFARAWPSGASTATGLETADAAALINELADRLKEAHVV